jgi:pyridoxamine 5'-phosphate oxidase
MDITDLKRNPLAEFENWFALAVKSGEKHPDAMTLATCTKSGVPSARVVLYKGLSKGAFRIFTNLESRKARELVSNPRAALAFHWKQLDRQVRVEGRIHAMPRPEAEKYFHSRPRTSQLGAWASKQSSVIPSREALLGRLRHYEMLFEGREVDLPEHWGGFLLVPERMEFWIDGEFRLHDRFEYTRKVPVRGKPGAWKRVRLSP